ncbi:FAD-dependent monooxygenase [Methyloceanibacter sp.]|uniref:FAD-dependent monooxygenase n=1 Tax=Methyloceanibacter sp. TaxID=1965321 RepID=UPI002D62E06A|nr:FAD-dependent monooxygenase [Methyloceanibacter sp.]HZP09572.1 FAD-dependent monooxygenase [Methyloceanibacter sp.]
MDDKDETIRDVRSCEAVVVGTGPAGLAGALALKHVGADVVLIGPPPARSQGQRAETRTAALLVSSIDFLKTLKVFDRLKPVAAPLTAIRIIDVSRSLVRAPDIEFRASELGLEAFGYNIANTALVEALYSRAQEVLPAILPTTVEHVLIDERNVRLACTGGSQVSGRLVMAADGRRSLCREAARIEVSEWRYDQGAIASDFRHSRPHRGVAIELHREGASLTTVPLPDPCGSALILVGSTAEIGRLIQCDEERFAESLADRLDGLLGSIESVGPRASFPVAGLTAKTLAARRIALVGEAGHILPPIGAQGLNLGLRDAAALADCIAEALVRRADPGGEDVLSAYNDARRLDVLSRAVGVDLLNRSLLTDFVPLQAARGIVLHGLNWLPPLRRLVMRVGLEPPSSLPRLMRGAQA